MLKRCSKPTSHSRSRSKPRSSPHNSSSSKAQHSPPCDSRRFTTNPHKSRKASANASDINTLDTSPTTLSPSQLTILIQPNQHQTSPHSRFLSTSFKSPHVHAPNFTTHLQSSLTPRARPFNTKLTLKPLQKTQQFQHFSSKPSEICSTLLEMEADVDGISVDRLKDDLKSENPNLDLNNPTDVIHAISTHNSEHADHHPSVHNFDYNDEPISKIIKQSIKEATSYQGKRHTLTQDDADLVSKLIHLTEPEARMRIDDDQFVKEGVEGDPEMYLASVKSQLVDPPGYRDGVPVVNQFADDTIPIAIGQKQEVIRHAKVLQKEHSLPPTIHHDLPSPVTPQHQHSELQSFKH